MNLCTPTRDTAGQWVHTGLLLAGWLLASSCHRPYLPDDRPRIATTTTYLEAVARDLLGAGIHVLRLSEPGACPGHFDLRPSQATELRRCRVLLRFDFQQSLDARLTGSHGEGPRVAEIALGGGMNLPASYLAACRQAAEHFVELGLLSPADADQRIKAVTARIEALARAASNRIAQAGIAGQPVLASGHQRDFVEWLGLDVVAVFRAADTASVRQIEEALAAGSFAQARLVIANRPEGRRTADALAERLQARVVVFENFPDLQNGRASFDAMLTGNVDTLLRAVEP
jgi:zinc transport system substrate-binding protein